MPVRFVGGEKGAESCHVSGCHGFLVLKSIKTSENFSQKKSMFAEDFSEDFSEDRQYHARPKGVSQVVCLGGGTI